MSSVFSPIGKRRQLMDFILSNLGNRVNDKQFIQKRKHFVLNYIPNQRAGAVKLQKFDSRRA